MHQRTAKAICILTACAVSLSAAHLSWTYDFGNRATCSRPAEIICSNDCKEIQVCLGNGQGGYTPTEVQTCGEGMRCDALTASCVEAAQSSCLPVNSSAAFTCYDGGAFPDPYNCSVFHVCLQAGGTAFTELCAAGSAYNPLTYECSLTPSDRVCTEGPITQCSAPGQLGVVPENPSIYYICAVSNGVLIPQMHRCHGGQIYDVSLAQCVDGSTTTPPPAPNGNCTTQLETAPDPDDCRSFYRCGPGNRWLHVTCAQDYHYEQAQQGCVAGSC